MAKTAAYVRSSGRTCRCPAEFLDSMAKTAAYVRSSGRTCRCPAE
eukprot:CAMPEP_0113594378 /NCGR_PEP_ID=MMETSP0015_2-20120614/39045_1 /TAXON_ID=2838 /ORGANISM="Odontella" /LENGTH=44 /DNA_ID=CAMNT_0000501371 /DNA_START=22 /DNA_END=156 /DNA_ORIENTATION=- /assembly_acc=CAM_ASM_000160